MSMTRGGFLAAILGAPWLAWALKLGEDGEEVAVIEPAAVSLPFVQTTFDKDWNDANWPFLRTETTCGITPATGSTHTIAYPYPVYYTNSGSYT